MRNIINCVLVLSIAIAASAQGIDSVRVLVPLYIVESVPGAYGSLWVSELRILNAGNEPAFIENYGPFCPVICSQPFAPGKTVRGDQMQGIPPHAIPAAILYIDPAPAPQFRFQSRVRDVSRGDQHWGAWIPVMREEEVPPGPVHLFNVPLQPGYRQLLRIYSFQYLQNQRVRVKVYGTPLTDPASGAPDPLLAELSVTLELGSPNQPAYAQITDIRTLLPVSVDATELRITLEPENPAIAVWGMVSVTNNTTQEITMIVPNQ